MYLSNSIWLLPQHANLRKKSRNNINIQAYTCFSLNLRLVVILVFALGQPADSFTRHMMAGMRGGQKRRGRALRRHGGGRRGGGPRYWKEVITASRRLPCVDFSWFWHLLHFIAVLPPSLIPNLSFLIQKTGYKLTCLQNTIAFLGFEHRLLHALTWRVSCVLRSVAQPFDSQQKMFN